MLGLLYLMSLGEIGFSYLSLIVPEAFKKMTAAILPMEAAVKVILIGLV